MKSRTVLTVLALSVFSVAPTFADHISGNSRELQNRSFAQGLSDERNFAMDSFNDSIFAQRLSSFDKHGKVSIASEFFGFKQDKNNTDEHSIAFTLKHGDPFGRSNDENSGKHKFVAIGGGSTLPTVSVPEPSSFTLVLFGLGVVGVFLNRRNPL